ncbi:MAG: flagellar biosynthetic protein FliO [Chitinophagales bacterium]
MDLGKWQRILALSVLFITISVVLANAPVRAVNISSEKQQVDLKYQEPAASKSPNFFWMALQMLFALGLIIFLAWVVIQVLGKRMGPKFQGKWIRVLDEVVLGQNRGVVILELEGRAFLLGVTDHNINVLMEIENRQIIETMLAESYNENSSADGLDKIISKIRDRIPQLRRDNADSFHFLMDDKIRTLQRMEDGVRRFSYTESGKKGEDE